MTLPVPFAWTHEVLAPLRAVNSYGLFAVMTTTRPEIIIEGSADGREWKPYEFRFKPGDVQRPPAFVAPHQPRLDWQMWFAALDTYEANPWFESLCRRLLVGSPAVIALLQYNPFPDRPPRFIRSVLYDYRFTGLNSNEPGRPWWRRTRVTEYGPVLSIEPR
jgi:hypothetical protein